jgi:hypothetical protein
MKVVVPQRFSIMVWDNAFRACPLCLVMKVVVPQRFSIMVWDNAFR